MLEWWWFHLREICWWKRVETTTSPRWTRGKSWRKLNEGFTNNSDRGTIPWKSGRCCKTDYYRIASRQVYANGKSTHILQKFRKVSIRNSLTMFSALKISDKVKEKPAIMAEVKAIADWDVGRRTDTFLNSGTPKGSAATLNGDNNDNVADGALNNEVWQESGWGYSIGMCRVYGTWHYDRK